MAQVIDANTIISPISKERRTYSVNIKGLLVHLFDILFIDHAQPRNHDASDLSSHMRKDIGLY